MPLVGSDSALSAALRAALLADPDTGAVDDVALTAFCDVIASVVLAHIVANASVSPAGVPPFSNSGGPVVGLGVVL